ncbi:MAG: protein kinase [Acidobacteriia bacterium]|nr:protein kinase [Terriglobia bacterium]
MIGQTISHYRIVGQLGSGGMGVVYKAEDTNLDRVVAVKFLAAHLLESEEHKQRFLREAKAAASLDHPNICMIHEVGEADGHVFIAMGYIDGPEVRDKIKERPLKLDEALDITIQAADGLRAAHQKGVVHRDIKSSNLMLTTSGQVKVLDFGLAQLTGGTRLTKTDTVLGTPAYMSPEQAQRLATDKRTDIWSLGVVLYEMVTGRLPFAGEREPAVIYSIIHECHEPITAIRAGVPLELDRIVGKALAKKPDERYQHLDDMLVDLRALRGNLSGARATGAMPTARSRKKLAWGALGAAGLLAAALVFMRPWLVTAPAPRLEYTQLTNFTDSATSPALSPDGRMLAFIRGESTFVGPGQIYIKLLPDGEPLQLTHDDLPKMSPKFSMDGARITYTTYGDGAGWNTWVVPVLGGQPRLFLANAEGLTWIKAGAGEQRLLFSEMTGRGQQMGIVTSMESRAQQRTVYMPAEESGMAHRSYLSPDGKQVLLVLMRVSRWMPCGMTLFDGSTADKQVGPSASQCTDAAWSPDGKWMYFSANTGNGYHIWRQRFPDGVPEQVTSGATEEEGIEFAPDGGSFVTSIGTSQSTLWVHDLRGERQITSEGFALFPSISSNGKKLYYLRRAGGAQSIVNGELWVADLESGQRERLLPDFLMRHYSISADGERVVFAVAADAERSPVWLAEFNRRSPPRQVTARRARKAFFGAEGEVLFLGEDKGANILYRVKDDSSDLPEAIARPEYKGAQVNLEDYGLNVSPYGKWVVARGPRDAPGALMVYPTGGGPPALICENCTQIVSFERGPPPPFVSWSPDGKFFYLNFQGSSYAIPLRPGQAMPIIPATGYRTKQEVMALPGARLLAEGAFPGPNPLVYAFTKFAIQRNIYRIPVP